MEEYRKRYTGPADPLPGLPPWESELLRARGMDTAEKAERFLHPRLEDLYAPERMQDLERAAGLIAGAVDRKEKILVYGDYDVDGICAVTVMLETLRELGARADFRIPGRHTEGYGLNENAVREIAADGVKLLITVDCGIASVKEVRLARELGMTVIVTDHHEIPDELPGADAVLDPLLGDYPFRRLCGAGVALKLCQKLLGPEGIRPRLEIAALATVADIVPLTDENRIIVREGMLRMAHTSRPGLRALMENARVALPLRSDDIAFRLGPRLNAAGRLEDASQGVRLLMTKDPAEARRIADHLEENNRKRQEMERIIIREALERFPRQVDLRRDRIIILEGEGWNTGLIGLAAGKICERYHHPTIVLSRQGGQAVGSCRSVPGINIWEMLNRCGDVFLRFGGHAQAAGLTVAAEKIPEMRERLNGAIRESCGEECFLPVREYDAELPLGQVTLEMIDVLEALEPTGYGNPAPVFRCRNASVQECRRVGKDQSHLKLSLLENGALLDGIGFGLGDAADRMMTQADVLFRPSRNEYLGKVTPQLQALAIRPAEAAGAEKESAETEKQDAEGISGPSERFFRRCLQEMSLLSAKQNEHIPQAPGLRPEHLLKERLAAVDASRETLGKIFLALRNFQVDSLEDLKAKTGMSGDQLIFALTAFRELGLVEWKEDPFRIILLPAERRTDLERSPVVRYLRRL